MILLPALSFRGGAGYKNKIIMIMIINISALRLTLAEGEIKGKSKATVVFFLKGRTPSQMLVFYIGILNDIVTRPELSRRGGI